MALNLASGNFDARPTAGLARASACSTEPVPASQHPCMQLLNDRWTHGAARAHVAPRSMRRQGLLLGFKTIRRTDRDGSDDTE